MKKRIYLDYAATTPVDPRIQRAMEQVAFGNPGSLHSFGQEAIAAVDRARETIAGAIGAEFRDIIFTGSATEANNLALQSAQVKISRPRLIVSCIEHESVLESARNLEHKGIEVIYLPVDHDGVVNLAELKASLNDHTILVSVMYANNEIGTIQPIAEIAKIIKEFKEMHAVKNGPAKYPLLHTDASQAFQFLDCDVRMLGVDLMTLSSHKIYGPKGAAALYARQAKDMLAPVIFGGGQEFGLRSGTENVPAIVGFSKAVELAVAMREKESKRIAMLRDRLATGIKKIFPKVEWNGGVSRRTAGVSTRATSTQYLPNILSAYFPGFAAQDLLTRLDLAGIAASSGSACRSRAFEASYVIKSLESSSGDLSGQTATARAKSSIRFSLGRLTTAREIDNTIKVLRSFRIF